MRKYRAKSETKTSKHYKEPTPEERSALEYYIRILTDRGDDPRSGLSVDHVENFNEADEFVAKALRRWIRSGDPAERMCKDWNEKLWEALRVVHHQLFLEAFGDLTRIGRTMTAPANVDKEPNEEMKQKIRAVGQKLWDAGGIEMMRAVFYPVVNSVRIQELNARLESLWSGIGTWCR